ncbi:MAG: methyltransferase domain-containing protein [Dehalococcoidia bacterium]|jgi:SAM-dependent methyltransferase
MPESHSTRLKALSERTPRLPRPPAYRYRANGGGHDGNGAMSRLDTVDLDLLGLREGDRLLDVGCGTGRHVVRACRKPCVVVGVDRDIDELMVLKFFAYCLACEGKLRARANAVIGDGLRLPLADESVDRVICTEVFEHVPDDRALIAELGRVLRPGGTIAVSVPDARSEWLVWRVASLQRVPAGEHVRRYRRGEMARLLRENGFEVYARRFRHSLETPFWLLALGAGEGGARRSASTVWKSFLDASSAQGSRVLAGLESAGNLLLPKSVVVYARRSAGEAKRCG